MVDESDDLPDVSRDEGADGASVSPQGSPLHPGDTIDDFEILESVGCGGMGVVYKAFEKPLRRVVALKVLNPAISGDPSLAKRFRREAILAANLSHPHIVPVYQVDRNDPPRYFTMEFVHGRSLKDKVEKEGYLSPAQAVRIALQVCDALCHAHEQNIIHRDIKPGNILLQNHVERARVTDFGIAQDVTGRLAERTETTGFSAGTPAFMSPEQNLGQALDGRTDVFSLGMTLYYMLTGQLAYHARNRAELALAFKDQKPAPPSRLNPDVPPELDSVVLRMIAVDSADRYADCREVAEALQQAVAPRPGAVPRPAGRKAAPFPWGRLAMGLVAMAALLSLVGLAWFMPWKGSGEAPTVGPGVQTREGVSGPSAPSSPRTYFEERGVVFSGWTYTVESRGRFASDGLGIYVSDWGDGGPVVAEKSLSRPLGPTDDFRLLVRLSTGQDKAGCGGWFSVALLDELGEAVAEVGWHDVQAAAGYGGVDFYAEGRTPLYRTDPTGFGREYPQLSGVLSLARSASRWVAQVNSDSKAAAREVEPRRTATRIRIAVGAATRLPPRPIRIEGLWVTGPDK